MIHKKCPVKGCERTTMHLDAVCRPCWRRTPPHLQGAFFLAWERKNTDAQKERGRDIVEWLEQHPEPCDAGASPA